MPFRIVAGPAPTVGAGWALAEIRAQQRGSRGAAEEGKPGYRADVVTAATALRCRLKRPRP